MIEVLSLPWTPREGPLYQAKAQGGMRRWLATKVLKLFIERSVRRDPLSIFKWMEVDLVFVNTGDEILREFLGRVIERHVDHRSALASIDLCSVPVRDILAKKSAIPVRYKWNKKSSGILMSVLIDPTVSHFADALSDVKFLSKTWKPDFDFRQLTEKDIVRVCKLYDAELMRRQEQYLEAAPRGKTDVLFQSLDKNLAIVELIDLEAFQYEGYSMGHCVANYFYFASSQQRILSVRIKGKPTVTVELKSIAVDGDSPSWRIAQAKSQFNSTPSDDLMEIIRYFVNHSYNSSQVKRRLTMLPGRNFPEALHMLEMPYFHIGGHQQAQNRMVRPGRRAPTAPDDLLPPVFHMNIVEDWYANFDMGRNRRLYARRRQTQEPFLRWNASVEKLKQKRASEPHLNQIPLFGYVMMYGRGGEFSSSFNMQLSKFFLLEQLSKEYEQFNQEKRSLWFKRALGKWKWSSEFHQQPFSSVPTLVEDHESESVCDSRSTNWFDPGQWPENVYHYQLVVFDSMGLIDNGEKFIESSTLSVKKRKTASPYKKPQLDCTQPSWEEARKSLNRNKPW